MRPLVPLPRQGGALHGHPLPRGHAQSLHHVATMSELLSLQDHDLHAVFYGPDNQVRFVDNCVILQRKFVWVLSKSI